MSKNWRCVTHAQGGGDGVVGGAEAGEDVIDKLIIADRRAGGGHSVGQGLHLVHVFRGRQIVLPQRLKLPPDVADIGAALGAEHGGDGCPHRMRRLAANELACNILIHGGEKKPLDALILNPPLVVLRVGDGSGSVADADNECFGRCRLGAIEVSVEVGIGKNGAGDAPQSMKLWRPRRTEIVGTVSAAGTVAMGDETRVITHRYRGSQ